MGFFKCSKFNSLINFQSQYPHCQSLNRHWSLLLDQTPLQLDREGIKEGEDGEKGGEGAIILGRQLFQIFLSEGGDYSRETINWGRLLFKEI